MASQEVYNVGFETTKRLWFPLSQYNIKNEQPVRVFLVGAKDLCYSIKIDDPKLKDLCNRVGSQFEKIVPPNGFYNVVHTFSLSRDTSKIEATDSDENKELFDSIFIIIQAAIQKDTDLRVSSKDVSKLEMHKTVDDTSPETIVAVVSQTQRTYDLFLHFSNESIQDEVENMLRFKDKEYYEKKRTNEHSALGAGERYIF